MQEFINPEELSTILAKDNGPVLLILLDRKISFSNQRQALLELFNLVGERHRIMLLDIEYQNTVTEKFRVHGSPAFIYCEQGKMKDVLLGTPDPEMLREFVTKNLPATSIN